MNQNNERNVEEPKAVYEKPSIATFAEDELSVSVEAFGPSGVGGGPI